MDGNPVSEWHHLKGRYMLEILRNPVAHAVMTGADQVIHQQAMMIAQLAMELDRYQGHQVLHCTDAQLDNVAVQSLDEPDGTIIRATDTGRELVMSGRTWMPRL